MQRYIYIYITNEFYFSLDSWMVCVCVTYIYMYIIKVLRSSVNYFNDCLYDWPNRKRETCFPLTIRYLGNPRSNVFKSRISLLPRMYICTLHTYATYIVLLVLVIQFSVEWKLIFLRAQWFLWMDLGQLSSDAREIEREI